jgi:hypothetical protein
MNYYPTQPNIAPIHTHNTPQLQLQAIGGAIRLGYKANPGRSDCLDEMRQIGAVRLSYNSLEDVSSSPGQQC